MKQLSFTGERMIPAKNDKQQFYYEHINRYLFASSFVAGKKVLDLACGVGYGSRVLKESGAASVVGVDISASAISYAKDKYGGKGTTFIKADALSTGLPSGNYDIIVCFEFIEHVKNQDTVLTEIKRLLIDYYVPITIKEAYFASCKLPKKASSVNPDPFIIPHNSGIGFCERVLVPYNYKLKEGLRLELYVKPFRKNGFTIQVGEKEIYKGYIKSITKEFKIRLDLSEKQLKEIRKDLIQNSGNFYFRDGSGRDRGAMVAWHKQFYEIDHGQYDKREAIPAFCGAGVLLNKKALQDVGMFDRQFFMYYEDADLSFRMREKGWNIIYNPETLIRHIHAASSGEWSDFFVYNAERGRLIFVARHWPRMSAAWQFAKYFFRNVLGGFALKKRFGVRLRVFISTIVPFFIGMFRVERISKREFKNLI